MQNGSYTRFRRLMFPALMMVCFLASLISVPSADAQLLKMGLMSEPKTLNPFLASDSWSREVLRHTQMSLYIYEPKDLSLIPWLAADQPVYGKDNLTATVKLRDALWSDGTPFTAEDVIFTAKVIEEFNIPRHRSRWEIVEKVEAVDPHTLRYTLKGPDASFDSSTLLSIIVQKKYWEPIVEEARKSQNPLTYITSHAEKNPPSLGPFYLKSWTQGSSILLLKNDKFFAKGLNMAGFDVGPYIEGILFKFYGNADAGIMALKKGDVDALGWTVSPGYVEDLEKDPAIEVFYNQSSGFNYLGFNCRKPPFSLKEFRQAVAYLIDKDFLVKRVLQGKGIRRDTVIAPGNKMWLNPDVPTFGKGESIEVRTRKAYELLKNAGWKWQVPPIDDKGNVQPGKGLTMPDGTVMDKFDLLTPPADYDPNRAISAMLIAEWLQKFGMPAVARPMAFNALLETVKAKHDFDAFLLGYGFIQPDPDIMRTFFDSEGDRKNGRNMTGYRNPEYDKLAEQSVKTMDTAERKPMIMKLQTMIAEDCPVIPLFASSDIDAVRKEGFTGWVKAQDGVDNLWSYLVLKPTKK